MNRIDEATPAGSEEEERAERGTSGPKVAALLMKHRTALQAYLLAATRHPQDAEDLLQEVSLAAVRSAERFRPGTDFLAWAREICRRRLLKYGARAGRAAAVLPADLLDLIERAAERRSDDSDRRREALRACLDELPASSRRILQLRYGEGASVEAVARAVRRTMTATYSLLQRFRLGLRDCMKRRLGGTA